MPDDEELLAALGEAIRAREAVPEWFVETGKNAYAWHNIDAELARLTYDSSRDRDAFAVVRSEAASIRALTFTSAQLSVELEVTAGSLVGQIIPPRAGTLEVHTTAGVTTSPISAARVAMPSSGDFRPFGLKMAARSASAMKLHSPAFTRP